MAPAYPPQTGRRAVEAPRGRETRYCGDPAVHWPHGESIADLNLSPIAALAYVGTWCPGWGRGADGVCIPCGAQPGCRHVPDCLMYPEGGYDDTCECISPSRCRHATWNAAVAAQAAPLTAEQAIPCSNCQVHTAVEPGNRIPERPLCPVCTDALNRYPGDSP